MKNLIILLMVSAIAALFVAFLVDDMIPQSPTKIDAYGWMWSKGASMSMIPKHVRMHDQQGQEY